MQLGLEVLRLSHVLGLVTLLSLFLPHEQPGGHLQTKRPHYEPEYWACQLPEL